MFNPHLQDVENPSLSCAAFAVHDRPAVNLYISSVEKCVEVIGLKAGEKIYDAKTRGKYEVGSCASSAIEDGRCPIESYERAVRLGHNTHFLVQLATVLSAHDMPRETYISLDIDATYYYEGRLFKIERTTNRNLKFVEIK